MNRQRLRQSILLGAIALGGCAARDGQESRSVEATIDGGSAPAGFEQVLYLPAPKCSAVLIETDVIVTADHCSVAPKQEVKNDTGTVAHTDTLVGGPSSYGLELWSIAPVSVFSPVPLTGDVTDLNNGEPILVVAYGETNPGTKSSLAGTVLDETCKTCTHQPAWIGDFSSSGGRICVGDSGGAAFTTSSGTSRLAGIMIGVYGMGDNDQCGTQERMATLDEAASTWLANQVKIYRQSKGPADSRE